MAFTYAGNSDFDAVRERAEKLYDSIGLVSCPYLNNKKIAFNARGIRHLKFKSDQKARSRADQYARLKLLHLAPQILRLSRTVQGIWQTQQFETEKNHSRWEHILRHLTFYEFMAVLGGVRVKVIVKQIGSGEPFFWSIIPFWSLQQGTYKRLLHSGNPEQD